MIFKDSYQTTIGSAFVTKQIETSINESIILDNVNIRALEVKTHGEFKPLFITGLMSSEANVPLFTHPITIKNHSGGKYLATDLRMFVNKVADHDAFVGGKLNPVVKNKTEYNFTKSRGVLNLIWVNEGVNNVKNNLLFGGIVFSAWLSEAIAKSYALDYKDQTVLAIIASYYYQTLFTDVTEIDSDTKQRMAVHTIKATKAPGTFVFEIFDKIESMNNINDFCFAVSSLLENVRLKNFNLAILLTIVKNSWYGTNAKEIISVALEHPPTWNAVVYTALNERTFKNSSVYKIAERFGKRGASDEYVSSYTMLVKDYMSPATEELVLNKFE